MTRITSSLIVIVTRHSPSLAVGPFPHRTDIACKSRTGSRFPSQDGPLMAVILTNPVMIEAYLNGVPGNGKLFPDGAKMAKIHWNPKKQETYPGQPTVPGTQHDVDFMVKDSQRFADSGGWGWAVFDYDAASDTFTPGTLADNPPQANDAKCGFACHTLVETRDYVFTEYGHR